MRSIKINIDNFNYLTGFSKQVGLEVEKIVNSYHAKENSDVEWVIVDDIDGSTVVYTRKHPEYWDAKNIGPWLVVNRKTAMELCCPLQYVLSETPSIIGKHQIYQHYLELSDDSNPQDIVPTKIQYIGQTMQGWQRRLRQHKDSAKKGSNTLFHRAMRNHGFNVVTTRIMFVGLSKEEADEIEEKAVALFSLFPLGLNMIPGGKAGAKFLFEHGGPRAYVPADRREEELSEIIRKSRLTGANPALSARWSDDAFAIKMICAAQNRLKPDQIEAGRLLSAAGHSTEAIVSMIGARNAQQVKRLLAGETYSRVA